MREFHAGRVVLHEGSCLDALDALAENSVDSCVCDPPYHLTSIVKRFGAENAAPAKEGTDGAFARASRGFMGKQWDGGDVAFRPETWVKVLRVLKPGAHLFAFGGTRTYHRMVCAIEDAGFEIRDQYAWAYGSGFPKSLDVAKAHDKALFGAFVDEDGGEPMPLSHFGSYWNGWGTAAKPAWEPIVLARKPLIGTVVDNLLAHGTGAINIDGCRIKSPEGKTKGGRGPSRGAVGWQPSAGYEKDEGLGRWPANLIHDGSPEVLAGFPDSDGQQGRVSGKEPSSSRRSIFERLNGGDPREVRNDSGSAARFFYQAKADADDRLGSRHPTVKPLDLMRWLVRLVTPPKGLCLDPFAGTGTTGHAALIEGMRAILVEREAEYCADIARRMDLVYAGQDERTAKTVKQDDHATMPLFGDLK